jgi:AcrR family transcriptional regulator
MSTTKRGRPRREGADDQILEATRELLAEAGYAAFNVDTIAERTGIAKTTIYRRWPTKGALVAAALDRPSSATDTASILRETANLLALLAGGDTDVLRAIVAQRRERLVALLGPRADLLLGALVTRVILGEAIAPDVVEEIVAMAASDST